MDFAALVTECAPWVAPQTMAAIVKTESQFNPLAININGGAKLQHQPRSREEAAVTARWLINNNYNIDMGLGQVNSANLKKTNLSIYDAFDPCKNLAAAAFILKWNYESASKKITGEQAALYAAISAYNTGSFTKGFSNGYVNKVVSNAGVKSSSTGVKKPVAPIAVIKTSKNDKLAQKKNEQPVRVSAWKDVSNMKNESGADWAGEQAPHVNETSLVVYEGAAVKNDVMVYR